MLNLVRKLVILFDLKISRMRWELFLCTYHFVGIKEIIFCFIIGIFRVHKFLKEQINLLTSAGIAYFKVLGLMIFCPGKKFSFLVLRDNVDLE